MLIWLNGELYHEHQAKVQAGSGGVLLGWGVFTTIGVWGGRPFALDRHLARLRRDAATTRCDLPFNDDALQDALHSVIALNGIVDGIARITVTRRGDGHWNRAEGADVSAQARPAEHAKAPAGLKLRLSPFRVEPRRALAGVKATSYLDAQLAWQQARDEGYGEAVLCNSQGALCECARSNLFWVRDGQLFTPSLESGCLAGIGRALVLEWGASTGCPAREGIFSLQELPAADEVFVTSAARGPRPVSTFCAGDNTYEYTGEAPATRHFQALWDAAVRGE